MLGESVHRAGRSVDRASGFIDFISFRVQGTCLRAFRVSVFGIIVFGSMAFGGLTESSVS